MSLLPSIIGGGTQILGQWAQYDQAKKANKQNKQQFDANMALQREFAQKGIQWRVADAKKAGIHPLAAMGANTASASPVMAGEHQNPYAGLSNMGQNISRAMLATMSREQKAQKMLETQNMRLRNEILNQELISWKARNNQSQTIPMGEEVQTVKKQRIANAPETQSVEAGTVTDRSYSFTGTGLATNPGS